MTLLLGSRADVAIIAGTGSNVLVRGENELLHQSGGQEWLACDDGSGFWIGLRGIREACRALEPEDESSALLARLCETQGVERRDRDALAERLRRLAVGAEGMKREAEALADRVVMRLRRHLPRATAGGRPLRLVECGGMFRSPM